MPKNVPFPIFLLNFSIFRENHGGRLSMDLSEPLKNESRRQTN